MKLIKLLRKIWKKTIKKYIKYNIINFYFQKLIYIFEISEKKYKLRKCIIKLTNTFSIATNNTCRQGLKNMIIIILLIPFIRVLLIFVILRKMKENAIIFFLLYRVTILKTSPYWNIMTFRVHRVFMKFNIALDI